MSKHGFQNPDLEPIWAEAQEHDLGIALHTFTAMPPYAPGGTGEVPEGEKITTDVITSVGEGVLMYASDFPHSESHFPDTVDMVLDWKMPQSRKRILLWDNALRFYKRANLS